MSGVHLTTISPSRTSSRRSTPCVEGCCGPNEMVICVSSGRSTTSNCGGRFPVEMLMLRLRVWNLKASDLKAQSCPGHFTKAWLFGHEVVRQNARDLDGRAVQFVRREL